jgi:hypothetical protein
MKIIFAKYSVAIFLKDGKIGLGFGLRLARPFYFNNGAGIVLKAGPFCYYKLFV